MQSGAIHIDCQESPALNESPTVSDLEVCSQLSDMRIRARLGHMTRSLGACLLCPSGLSSQALSILADLCHRPAGIDKPKDVTFRLYVRPKPPPRASG